MAILFNLLLVFCSVAGFLLSLYIFHKKHSHEKMLCPVGGKCDTVISSEYNKFFGIPLEIIGMGYYGIIFTAYTTLFLIPGAQSSLISFGLFVLTITAFLFSLYLTFIQGITLKQWCTLCLTSAGFCTIILTSALITSEQSFPALLQEYQPLIASVYLLALAVGLGCATVTDVFFLKFLKDYRISEDEYNVLKTLSQMMWTALSAIIVAGIGLSLASGGIAAFSPNIIVSWIALLVTIINGTALNLVIAPKLLHISFREKHDHEPGELRIIHKLAFELGGVSLASWYTAFLLTVTPNISIPLLFLGIGYFMLVLIAVVGGRILEYSFRRRSRIIA